MKITTSHTPQVQLPFDHWQFFHASMDWVAYRDHPRKEPGSYTNVLSPHYIATWVIRGTIEKRSGYQRLKATAGEWIFQQPGKNIVTHAHTGTMFLEIGFSIRWQGDGNLTLPPQQTFWKAGAWPELEDKATRLARFSRDHRRHAGPDYKMRSALTPMGHYLQHQHLFLDWLTSWEEVQRRIGMGWQYTEKQDDKMLRALLYLKGHPLHLPISVRTMATSLGMSTVHLINEFRKAYHTTPKAYRMRIKLELAIRELQSTRKEVKEIAGDLGYSVPWFCTWIKKETSKKPSEIRNEGLLNQQNVSPEH